MSTYTYINSKPASDLAAKWHWGADHYRTFFLAPLPPRSLSPHEPYRGIVQRPCRVLIKGLLAGIQEVLTTSHIPETLAGLQAVLSRKEGGPWLGPLNVKEFLKDPSVPSGSLGSKARSMRTCEARH